MASIADVLAIAAHRDDVEQTCGGTLLRSAARGLRTAILDLTQGEAGTRGTAGDRAREAEEAARLLGVSWRRAFDLPDGAIANTLENRTMIVRVLREVRPRVVILPYWKGRHPDHYTCSVLGYEACFLAGLAKLALSHQPSAISQTKSSVDAALEGGEPFAPYRPFKILYATLYYDVRPTFVVDISAQFEQKFASILAYKSQFSDQEAGKDLFPAHQEIRARVDSMARYYGLLGGVTHAEPFFQKEVGLVEDLLAVPVKSI